MKHTLQISVSKKPVNSGAISVRRVSVRAAHAFPLWGYGQADGHCSGEFSGRTLNQGSCGRRKRTWEK